MWEEDGHCMVESASILRYLADKNSITSQGSELYPKDLNQRHWIDLILDFCGNGLRPALIESTWKILFFPALGLAPIPSE